MDPTKKSAHSRVIAADIHGIEMNNAEDSVTVTYNIDPDGNGRNVTVSKKFEFSMFTDPDFQDSALIFVESVVKAIRREEDYLGPVPCDTCTGACCRAGWDIRVTKSDVLRMVDAGLFPDDHVKFYGDKLWRDSDVGDVENVWTGFCGTMKLEPRVNEVSGVEERACTNLDKNGRCGIYEHRPKVCRDYDWVDCDKFEADPKKIEAADKKKHLPVLNANKKGKGAKGYGGPGHAKKKG